MRDQAPIIVKKVKKHGDHGHHGGAWKVAYADFVTAMMAFFLLMWLLNATSEEQLHGLADYFDPAIPISRNSAGGAGMLSGETIFTQERIAGAAPEGIRARPSLRDPGEDLGEEPGFEGDPVNTDTPGGAPNAEILESSGPGIPVGPDPVVEDGAPRGAEDTTGDEPGEGAMVGMVTELDPEVAEAARAAVEAELTEAVIEAVGDEAIGEELLKHFNLKVTPEGVVIEIADLAGSPLFAPGSAEPSELLRFLLRIATGVLSDFSADLAVVGHTDASPFRPGADYTNWELSTDRANAARRLMGDYGMAPGRIARVSGHADTQPLSGDPFDPRNRRIAIIMLRPGIAN